MTKPRPKGCKPPMYRVCCWMLLVLAVCSNSRAEALTEVIKDDHLEGPNVCKEVENITVTITTPREEAYQERYQKWCLGIPPRCSAYRIKSRIVNETRTIIKQRIVKKCCVGYTLSEDQNHCVAECKAGCRHGQCIEPDVCRCDEGYAGKSCNTKCPPNRWGSDCSQKCKCTNNSVCNAADGSCHCQRGFKGRYCEEACASDRFGQDCAEVCQCANGGTCDHVSGECYCAAGFTGPLCLESCPPGTHGAQCQSKCRCQNGGTCDPVTGECICPAGYTGTVCANRCQPGLYGLRCAERCECFNGADCDRVTGQCICAPGFMGAKCLDSCPNGQYGINCTETCRCQNGAPCDSADGKCSCPDGWTGADCSQRVCPIDQYGPNCTGTCDCFWNNTKMCHPWTGKCLCKPGWSNNACDRPCRFLRYGQDCQLSCNCKNSSPCSHIDGTCLCIAGFRGESCEEPCSNNTYGQNCSEQCQCMNGATCEGDSGKCVCAPGWQGIKCDRPCDAQHFGRDCTEKCLCQNGGVCNPINGHCTCPAGWTGELCDKKCTPGRFGQNCEQVCDCHLENIIACNATNGRCICKADWGGVRCESRCPIGFYGETCSEICTCHNNSSCDPTSGECICSSGWTGPTCTEPCPAGFFGHGCKQRCPGSTDPNRRCNPISGQYSCPPGYTGPTCEHPCSSGFYGQDCQKRCSCQNGGECSHVTGQCQCPPGWTGPHCETVCEEHYYGINCSQKCNCRNNARCRKNDGNCICEAGWMGHRCDEVCPDGFYGNHCMDPCNCSGTGNFLCHAAKGCVCQAGFKGKNCDVKMQDELIQERIDEVTPNAHNLTLENETIVERGIEESNMEGKTDPLSNGSLLNNSSLKVYNISIALLDASIVHEQDRHHIVVNGEEDAMVPEKQMPTAPYNVTIVFPLYANSFLLEYNRTHVLRPGQQVTLLYQADGFLDLTVVQMHSYVSLQHVGNSTNFMETFINSTSYRVQPDSDLVEPYGAMDVVTVFVAYVNLQQECVEKSGNRSIALRMGQKIVIRLVETGAELNDRDVVGESINSSAKEIPEQSTVDSTGHTTFTDGWEEREPNISQHEETTTEYGRDQMVYFNVTGKDSQDEAIGIQGDRDDQPTSTEMPPDAMQSDEFSTFPSIQDKPEQSPFDSSPDWTTPHDDDERSSLPTMTVVLHGEDSQDIGKDTLNVIIPHPYFSYNDEYLPDNGKDNIFGVATKRTDSSEDRGLAGASNGSGTVWAIVLTIVFGSVVAAILLYYRRRVANLKAEVNHVVNYMTQEQPSHFDNPVYARTGNGSVGGGGGGGGANGIANGGTIPPLDARMGLLRSVMPNNLRKPTHDKYSYPDNEYGTDKSYSISHYGPESLKNFEADLTNPNCFKDHVYDEIRLKDSIAALSRDSNYGIVYTEYDHLDYSRPGSSHKAHYFRMSDDTPNGTITRPSGLALPNHYQYQSGTAGPSNVISPGAGGSPKAINVLREANGTINNLSAPPRVNLMSMPTGNGTAGTASHTDANLGNDLSSSSNSSPTPPAHSPSTSSSSTQEPHHLATHRLVAASPSTPPNEAADDAGEAQQLYMPMSSGEASGSASHGGAVSDFGGAKIPDHQLNIKE